MLYGNYRNHAVSSIIAGKVGVFVFQVTEFPGVLINDFGKSGFESVEMSTAFHRVDVIAETYRIVAILLYKAECGAESDIVSFSVDADCFREPLAFCIGIDHFIDECGYAIRFMEYFLGLFVTFIAEHQCEVRIQIRCFFESFSDGISLELHRIENRIVRIKRDGGSRAVCISDGRQQFALFDFYHRSASCVLIMMDFSVPVHINNHFIAECVDYGRTDAVQTA